MKLSELTYHDGPPAEVEEGMAIRYSLLIGGIEYGVVGTLRTNHGPDSHVEDLGCGCCSSGYKITGWVWLAGEPVED